MSRITRNPRMKPTAILLATGLLLGYFPVRSKAAEPPAPTAHSLSVSPTSPGVCCVTSLYDGEVHEITITWTGEIDGSIPPTNLEVDIDGALWTLKEDPRTPTTAVVQATTYAKDDFSATFTATKKKKAEGGKGGGKGEEKGMGYANQIQIHAYAPGAGTSDPAKRTPRASVGDEDKAYYGFLAPHASNQPTSLNLLFNSKKKDIGTNTITLNVPAGVEVPGVQTGETTYDGASFGNPKTIAATLKEGITSPQTIKLKLENENGEATSTAEDTVVLLPVRFKKMWETPNKANQTVINARRDDPASSSQQPDAQDNLYGTPRNMLYITADPTDGKYHVSVDIATGLRDQFVCAAYLLGNGTKISGSDKPFPADDAPADMLIPSTADSQSGDHYEIKVAFDTNKNGLIDESETPIRLVALDTDHGLPPAPVVHGFSLAAVEEAKSTIQGQAFGTGWTGWKPNLAAEFFVPNAIALEKLFYTGGPGQLDASYAPTVTLQDASLNALGSSGDFSEWLTHHTGSQFNTDGLAEIKHYQWAGGTKISNLIAASTPLSTLKSRSSIVSQMETDTATTVEAYRQTGVAAGQSQVFPDSNGHDLQTELAALGKPHWSPSWIPTQTLLIGDEDGYAGAIPDDAFGTVGRSRFTNAKYWFVVKKETRIDYAYIPDSPPQESPYTAVVVYLRISGTSQDLYDFNHNGGGLSIPAAITQLSYGNGSYGRSNGIIYRTSVNILNDYEMKEIRLP